MQVLTPTTAAQRIVRRASAGNRPTPADYEAHLVIQDKHEQIVAYRPNRAQLDFREKRTGRDLVLKARQMGLSTEIQAQNFVEANVRRVRSATLAHDDKGTSLLRSMAERFWLGLPETMRPPRGLDNATTTTYPVTGSEVTIVTAGGRNKGRAGTYSIVHGSEVAFWPDAGAIMAGLMQGVPTGGSIVLESTPNGAQGWFYERCMEALDGDSDWTLHFYPWYWDDGYRLDADIALPLTDDEQRLMAEHSLDVQQIAWRRSKQRELGRLFQQEYPEDPRTCFLVSGNGYFSDIRALDDVYTAPTNATPAPGHAYTAGLDFAQTSDFTVLSIGDVPARCEVELIRLNKLSWSEMRGRVVTACKRWGVKTLFAEANSMGSTNIEELAKELRAADTPTQIVAFQTTAQSKPPLISGLHWALDEGGLKLLPDPVGRQEINTFVASQTINGNWKYEAANGGHDDTVIGRALMWHGMSTPVSFTFGDAPRSLSDLFGGIG